MTLVRVKGFWLNPEMVVGVWHEHIVYSDGKTDYWRVTLRCEEGQVWQWKYEGDGAEENASRDTDDIAAQVNAPQVPYSLRDPYVPPSDQR